MYDAVIVGAGPAGSTAARLLARAGWSVAIIEKAAFPRRKVCGEFLSATNLPLFDEDILREEFLSSAGAAVRNVGLFVGEVGLSAVMPNAPAFGGWGRALGREVLDTILLEASRRADAEIFQPWKMVVVEKNADGFRCEIEKDGKLKDIRARFVIAANGSWEHSAFLDNDHIHRPSDLLAFKAHFRGGDLPHGLMPLLAFPGGYGGLVHTDNDRVSLSCCIRRDRLEQCRAEERGRTAGAAVLNHILRSCDGARNALGRAELQGSWLAAGPIRPGIRPRFRDGIFRIGNLAGEAHPVVAEGISMAMQSALLLCGPLIKFQNKLGSESTIRDVGKTYSRDWRRHFAPRIRAASLFAHLAMRPRASGFALPLLKKFPEILTFGARLSGKAKPVPITAS